MQNQGIRKCLLCGRRTIRLICLLCAARLQREVLSNEIESEKRGKKPLHFQHS